MKTNPSKLTLFRGLFVILLLIATSIQIVAQQTNDERQMAEIIASRQANKAMLAEIRTKAESGDAQSQLELGRAIYMGNLGEAKDAVEALKWYRKAAEQKYAAAQYTLGNCYYYGYGVEKNMEKAVEWYRKAAEQSHEVAQYFLPHCFATLGMCYADGLGVTQNSVEAVKWYRKAAELNDAVAQFNLGLFYATGQGVAKDAVEAVRWYRKAAEQNDASAQINLGVCYIQGQGVVKDYVEAYKWILLAAAQGDEKAKRFTEVLEHKMTGEQIAEGQKMARSFKPSNKLGAKDSISESPTASGTGFFISDDGYLISNNHVVEGVTQVRLVTSAGLISAKVVKVDAANDLALLKAEGRFAALPVAASRGVKLGGTVATVGFPNIGLQGFAPKLAKGEIASLSGAGDDARYFQISVPVQPGNSGGALVDERGNVVGVVSAKLNASAALALSGTLPENVNYAVKSSYLLSFLEVFADGQLKLKEPATKEKKFEDVVKEAEQAAVLVLVY